MKTIESAVEEVFELYRKFGQADYIGEPVSQLEHMSQSAQLAMEEGCDNEVVLAAFFHDIGHICVMMNSENGMDGFGVRSHEKIGADYLRSRGFPNRVAQLVENHVQAKRYLTYKHSDYYLALSEASKKTLEFQGGPMTAAEAEVFEKDPLFETSLRMRTWDERAKIENQPICDLNDLQQRALAVLRAHALPQHWSDL